MRATKATTPDEIFRNEMEPSPHTLKVAAAEAGGRRFVRFKIGENEVYYTPEDCDEIAAAILECAHTEIRKEGK